MRRLISLAVMFVTIALAGAALAQTTPDVIGIFMEEEGYSNCGQPLPYTAVTVYLLAKDISEPSGMSAWECSLVTDPATFAAGVTVTLANGGVNALAAPDYAVALPAAVPRAAVIKLATWSTFYLGGEIMLGLGPSQPGHFAEDPGPGYAAGDEPTRWTRLHLRCAWGSAPRPDTYYAATLGLGCPVIMDPSPCWSPIQASTWGTIKEMYR